MRVAALGFAHEANTFSSVAADLAMWERAGIHRGADIIARYADSDATMAGFLELAEVDADVEVVPLYFTRVTPAGRIPRDTFEHLVGAMLDELEAHGPWDVVLLAQHGSAVAEGFPDADGEVVRRVRELIGHKVIIGVCLDMHANLSSTLVEAADVVTVYQTNPHVDARVRALDAARIAVRAARGEVRPVASLAKPPVAIDILRQGTDEHPMNELVALGRTLAKLPGVIDTSVVEGYPYADVEHMGMGFLAITDGDRRLAEEVAVRMADRAWDLREHFVGSALAPDDAVRAAAALVAQSVRPVVLLDTGDNVGGGSPADSTVLLESAQRFGVAGLFITLCDPSNALRCYEAGVGARVELEVGAATDDRHGRPVRIAGRVRLLHDGEWEDHGPTHGGFSRFATGLGALIATEDGHTVLLNSVPQGNTSLGQLRAVGVEPTAQPIIVAKGVQSPRAAFGPVAGRMILVATPGVTSADLSVFDYEVRRRPMHPFEQNATWSRLTDDPGQARPPR